MRASLPLVAVALCLAALGLAAGSGTARAQDNPVVEPLIGTWTATDPVSGQQGQLIITERTLQFGAGEPEIPYTAEGSGNTYSLFIGGPEDPASFTFLSADAAELAVPGGPVLALTRAPSAEGQDVQPPAGGAGGAESSGGSLYDELARAAAPYGVATRYEPLNESLEALLSAGWKLDQAAGASGGFTLLLTKGSSNALCVLVPRDLGQADTALSDCRRLIERVAACDSARREKNCTATDCAGNPSPG